MYSLGSTPGSALDSGHQVVEEEEDEDQPQGDVAEEAAVVSARSHHAGETLHAAAQQARGAQEVGVLTETKGQARQVRF